MITPSQYFTSRDPEAFFKWQQAVVGIAGAGGLGSNVAIALARGGISKLVLADFDAISLDNLNRQQFTLTQVGQPKVSALAHNICLFNPFISLELHEQKVDTDNLDRIFGLCDILVEAFDRASEKEMLISSWLTLHPDRPLVAASGLAGYGRSQEIKILRDGLLYVVGDQSSELTPGISPIAPRVAIVANMQANLVLELLAEA